MKDFEEKNHCVELVNELFLNISFYSILVIYFNRICILTTCYCSIGENCPIIMGLI